MENPIQIIEKIKNSLEDILIEENIDYLGKNTNDILNVYSADFCGIMLQYFPGATIMMNKSFKKCSIMIQGVIYDSYGIVNPKDYFIAKEEEINFIQKSFNHLSDSIIEKLISDIFREEKEMSLVFSLRKNRDSLS